MRLSLRSILALVIVGGLLLGNLYIYQAVASRSDGLHHIYFLDVDQGDSILIRTAQGENLPIDGGPDNQAPQQLGRYLPFWDPALDLVLLTHAHADHAAGLVEIVRNREVKNFWYSGSAYDSSVYQSLIEVVESKKIPINLASSGDFYQMADGNLHVHYPFVEAPEGDDPNELSVVSQLVLGDFSLLLTGDAGVATEAALSPMLNDVDVLKVGHHGSRYSSAASFLSTIDPEVAVISAGLNNRYGHPHIDTIERLQAVGAEIYRTDQQGTIHLITDGQRYRILTD